MNSRTAQVDPPCAEECIEVLRQQMNLLCRDKGVPMIETHITNIAPLIPPLYPELNMRCPHGVLWHMQPTSEQIAEWVEAGVE